MKLSIILPLLAATWPLVSANPDAPEGYGVDTIEWDVQVTPNGEFVTLNGTLEDVHAELLELNPRWDEEFLTDENEGNPLAKRTDFYGSKTVCGKFGSSARFKPIQNGIKYLRGVSGHPRAGPGPAKCARVSCSYNSAIWWCNDSKSSKTLNSFGSIADGAAYVLSHCTVSGPGISNPSVNGQVFHKTNWNVYVRGASC
ncbi:hypothetical protein BJY00DRAFT_310337 [Aspergillus carlsbadensis]|nr:hypothetical protein BJY00DRAFT_310337 [Aspergillus carlsbadensis]